MSKNTTTTKEEYPETTIDTNDEFDYSEIAIDCDSESQRYIYAESK